MAYYNLGDTFKWFMGRVVEIDPVEDPPEMRYLGRVKVRVLHEQTGELGKVVASRGIPDSKLLWAWPLSSIQSASLSYRKIVEHEKFDTPFWIDAVGTSPTGIAVGTYVFGFYLDGHEKNIPLIMSTYHKLSIYPDPPTDPATGEFLQIEPPTEDNKYMDVSALAKGWNDDPKRIVNHPLGADLPIKTAPNTGGQLLPKHPYKRGLMNIVWQPPSDYHTTYPYNFVHTTKSGHAIELDDTPGFERIHWWHRSGSYEEVSSNKDGVSHARDGLKKPYPESMAGWPEPNLDYTGFADPYEGRRVKKTTGNDYTLSMQNKETYIGGHEKLEVSNNSISGFGNNVIETVANNVFIAVGYYPRSANNTLAGESARYQIDHPWSAAPGFERQQLREGIDKLPKILPGFHEYNYITDVANNVQTSIGWTWKKVRELTPPEMKNHYIELANNQLTTIGWIPQNDYDKDGEARSLIPDLDVTNHYIDIKNNSLSTIGWKPSEEARLISDVDSTNHFTDVKNNAFLNIGYMPTVANTDSGDIPARASSETANFLYTDVKNNTVSTTANNYMLSVGYDHTTEPDIAGIGNQNYRLDVRNTAVIRTDNVLYEAVGVTRNRMRDLSQAHDRSHYVDVDQYQVMNIGADQLMFAKGNMLHSTEGSHYLSALKASYETIKGVKNIESYEVVIDTRSGSGERNYKGLTIFGNVLIKEGTLDVADGGATGSFTTADGKRVKVKSGIITVISPA